LAAGAVHGPLATRRANAAARRKPFTRGTGPGVQPHAAAAMARMMLRSGASAGPVGDTEGDIAESV